MTPDRNMYDLEVGEMRVAENPKCKERKDMFRTPDDDIMLIKKLKEEGKISDDELVRRIVEIMIKHRMRPKALYGFDAVRVVREAREE